MQENNQKPPKSEDRGKELKLLRATKKQLSDRINYAFELMMNDFAPSQIHQILLEKYGVTKRQAERYLYCANLFLEEKTEVSRKRKLAWYKARKFRLLRDMDPKEKKTAAGVRAIDGVLNSMAKLEGLMIDKVAQTDIKGDDVKQPPLISITTVSSLPVEFKEY